MPAGLSTQTRLVASVLSISAATSAYWWSALGGTLPPDVLARGTGLLVAGVMLILGLVAMSFTACGGDKDTAAEESTEETE